MSDDIEIIKPIGTKHLHQSSISWAYKCCFHKNCDYVSNDLQKIKVDSISA